MDLIIHLVCLARNLVDLFVLRIRLGAHGATKLIEALCCAVEKI
jgi:hypothetical protein